jgi:hypothetical protein
MSGFKHQYLGAEPARRNVGQTQHAIGKRNGTAVHDLQYSSPWPWIFATVISLAMWASIAWLVRAAIGSA